jgi:hypothetical protein
VGVELLEPGCEAFNAPTQFPQALGRRLSRRVTQEDPLFARDDLRDLPDRNDKQQPREEGARTAIKSGRSERDT